MPCKETIRNEPARKSPGWKRYAWWVVGLCVLTFVLTRDKGAVERRFCLSRIGAIWQECNMLAVSNGSFCTPFLAQRFPGDGRMVSTFGDGTYDLVEERGYSSAALTCPSGGLYRICGSVGICTVHGFCTLDTRPAERFSAPPPHDGVIVLDDGTCFVGEDFIVIVAQDSLLVASSSLYEKPPVHGSITLAETDDGLILSNEGRSLAVVDHPQQGRLVQMLKDSGFVNLVSTEP